MVVGGQETPVEEKKEEHSRVDSGSLQDDMKKLDGVVLASETYELEAYRLTLEPGNEL